METKLPNHAGVVSATARTWGGLPFFSIAERDGYADEFAFPECSLWLADSGTYDVRWREGAREDSSCFTPGSVSFWSKGHVIYDCEGKGSISALCLCFPERQIEAWLHNEASATVAGLAVAPYRLRSDAFISTLMRQIAAEIRDSCSSGALFAESISMALLTYLAGNLHRKARQTSCAQPLGGRGIEKVRAYIDDHLADDLSLLHMAALAGLSPRHLCRTFRLATGESVHQYVIRRRIDRAKGMLRHRSVTEVAMHLGFASSSHFSNAFRKVVGCSPAQFKRQT